MNLDNPGVSNLFKKLYLSCSGADNIFIVADQSQTDKQTEIDTSQKNMIAPGSQTDEQLSTIMMGTEIDKIKEWLTAVSKEKAQDYLNKVSREQQVADSKNGLRSYIGSFFFNPTQP